MDSEGTRKSSLAEVGEGSSYGATAQSLKWAFYGPDGEARMAKAGREEKTRSALEDLKWSEDILGMYSS